MLTHACAVPFPAGMYGMWAEQMRNSWREHPHNAQAVSLLSDECKDLLDKMFEIKKVRGHLYF